MPDPVPTFSEVVTRIRDDHPGFAYIHILEPATAEESNKFLRDIWGGRPYIANSDFGRDSAIEAAEKEGGLISFGRHFISNVSFLFFFFYYRRDENIGLLFLTHSLICHFA